MQNWSLHYLNARFAIDPIKDRIDRALIEVHRRAIKVIDPMPLDIIIQTASNAGIPEVGHVGYSPRPGVMMLTFDPDNPNLASNLGEPLERMIAHELHHALRWDAIGYGTTLGEALISEGLAGRFVQELFGNDGEIWETAVRREDLGEYAKLADKQADMSDYDHGTWFFGKGELPRWVGYTLGWEVVGDYLKTHFDARPSMLAAAPADQFLLSLAALSK